MNPTNGIPPAIERAWSAAVMDSDPLPKNLSKVKGYDFNEGVQYDKIFGTLSTMGFQVGSFNVLYFADFNYTLFYSFSITSHVGCRGVLMEALYPSVALCTQHLQVFILDENERQIHSGMLL